jgi:2-polyprenyl-6-methoxyphenol hydroxylase-like FAD-dependent oxidoreductase
MSSENVVVLGAGPAGLTACLALARSGHQVTVLERDPAEAAGSDPFGWKRKGIPHFGQPHMLIPRACKELRENLADVYAALLSAGATELDMRPRLQGTELPGDEDLLYLAVRRPVLEGALRAAALAEPGVHIRFHTEVGGLLLDAGRVVGVNAAGTDLEAGLVVDAMGRRSPMAAWLAANGRPRPPQETSPCGVIYYSRYYRVRPGKELPAGPWLLGPRGDLGFMGFATFPGDNGTFAALLSIPTHVPELRSFKDSDVFDAAVAKIQPLRMWVDPELVDPITPVRAMAGLENTLKSHSCSPDGLFTVGDALSHTDPTLAHGIAFALIHARALAAALAEHDDLEKAFVTFGAATTTAMRERFELATAVGAQRHKGWTGGTLDVAHRDGDYALFSIAAAGAAAMVDPDVLRVFVRRLGLLDSTRVLDDDLAMQDRIEKTFGEMLAQPRPPAGPTREEMLNG